MAKSTEIRLGPNAPIFRGPPRTFTPVSRPLPESSKKDTAGTVQVTHDQPKPDKKQPV